MKKSSLIPFALSISSAALAGNINHEGLPAAAQMVTPSAVGTYEIYSAKQFIGPEQCTYNIYRIRGEVTGVDNDIDTGSGLDEIEFQVWDDGVLKDSETITVPVGMTMSYDVTLEFDGVYSTGSPGVGLYSEIDLYLDPFFPDDVVVDDCEQSLKCWVTPTVADAGDEVTVHARFNLTEDETSMTAYSMSLVPIVEMTDDDGDGEFTGSFIVNELSRRGPHLYPVRATIGDQVFWCPGFKKPTPSDCDNPHHPH